MDTLSSFIDRRAPLPAGSSCAQAAARFQAEPDAGLLAVVDGELPVGLVARDVILSQTDGDRPVAEVMDSQPLVVDHLILMRPEDDLNLTGKSKTLWQEAERNGKHARLEPLSLDGFALLYGFPRWLSALREALPAGAPLPNLADRSPGQN